MTRTCNTHGVRKFSGRFRGYAIPKTKKEDGGCERSPLTQQSNRWTCTIPRVAFVHGLTGCRSTGAWRCQWRKSKIMECSKNELGQGADVSAHSRTMTDGIIAQLCRVSLPKQDGSSRPCSERNKVECGEITKMSRLGTPQSGFSVPHHSRISSTWRSAWFPGMGSSLRIQEDLTSTLLTHQRDMRHFNISRTDMMSACLKECNVLPIV